MSTAARPVTDRRGFVYKPAIGPGLKPLLWVVLIGFALLGANGVYLASITALTYLRGVPQETYFSLLMVIVHLVLGVVLIVPFLIFGFGHLVTSWARPNKVAVRLGIALLIASLVILVSGIILVRLEIPIGPLRSWKVEVKDPAIRSIGYWVHVAMPVLAIVLYVRHRLAGPRIRWEWAKVWVGAVAGFVALMALMHSTDPRLLTAKGPRSGRRYFFPSEAVTANGKFIPVKSMMMDDYCLKCHKDAYDGWFHSAHHFSSFNNKAYLSSVRETRKIAMERDGNTQAARWCAGCHDPVPFFGGEFDDPKYDDEHAPSSQAGITCTACHAITHVNSTRGNADYTITEPVHYPFAYSENPFLQWINNTLVKAKPAMHARTFLKPIHKDSQFCSTCHKVGLPFALNHYKDFLRGQNHYDTYLLSGVSGHGARSFYYPPPDQRAKGKCADCHMNFVASNDFGAREFDGKPGREIHNHFFVGANTGLAAIRGREDIAKVHEAYLKDKKVRIDVFGIREGSDVEGPLTAPLRPASPELKPGGKYLVETVVRTLGLGHPLTQGTVDSNEIWVELIARTDGRIIGRSGGIDNEGTVDPYSHFINVYMLDRNGKRIDRRNPQDIFVPLYNKQVPPGAGQVVHFGLDVPKDVRGPITLEARVNYRKFDRKYMDYVFGPGKGPKLPVTLMAKDSVDVAIAGGPRPENPASPIKETWQRWNDYGIGLFLEGTDKGGQKGELKQAEVAFKKVAALGRADGWVNLARVYQREGRIPDAVAALKKAAEHKEPAAPWVITWLTGQINYANGELDAAIKNYEDVLATRIPERGFDFSQDYEVINLLGRSLYRRSLVESRDSPEQRTYLDRTIAAFRRTLAIDSENVEAHYGLGLAYEDLARLETVRGGGAPAPLPRAGAKAEAVTVPDLIRRADELTDPKAAPAERAARTEALAVAINAFLDGPRPQDTSRLEPLHEVVEKLGPVLRNENDACVRAALARALAVTHKRLHGLFKPDEVAEGRAVALARRENPAADMNAQSIVIHPLHRPGAPGIDPKPVAAREVTR